MMPAMRGGVRVLLIGSMSMVGCPRRASPPTERGEQSTLVVLHTNDIHANYLPSAASWLDGRLMGGMEWLDIYVRRERVQAGAQNVLLLDAGDILTGTPLSDVRVGGVRGAAMTGFLAAIGYDAWTLGNHEFDRGWRDVMALVESSPVPVVCANLSSEDPTLSLRENLPPSLVTHRAGLDVAVIGVITEELTRVTAPGVTGPLVPRSAEQAVREQMLLLEPETDIQIALSHLGVEADQALARAVPDLDLVVGGHSHTPLDPPLVVGTTWIVQSRPACQGLGRVDLTVEDGEIVHVEARIIDLLPLEGEHGDGRVADMVRGWQAEIQADFGEPLGASSADLLRHDHSQGGVGSWITDVLRQATGAQVAIYNASGLRADLAAGELTRLHLYQVFPFGNMVVTMQIAGTALQALLEGAVRDEAGGTEPVLQFSGVQVHWRAGPPVRIESILVGGVPLVPEDTYTLATNSFLASLWADRLPGTPLELETLPYTVREAAERAVRGGMMTTGEPRSIQMDAGDSEH